MLYFAYGSNLHPVRLTERVPSAAFVGVATLTGYSLQFNKRSTDGSAKCSIFQVSDSGQVVYGAVFDISAVERPVLDGIEGLGRGYVRHQISVDLNGAATPMFTYIVEPSHLVEHMRPYEWYRELVELGAQYHGFPEDYVSLIQAVSSQVDPDDRRSREQQALLQRLVERRS